jgi:DNA-binding NarL/FixJ family response regulator
MEEVMSKRQKVILDNRSDATTTRTDRASVARVALGPVARVTSKTVSLLLVEDDELIRAVLCSFVKRVSGVHVVGAAANGREALLKVEELQPNLVLTDIRMPGLDGIALTRELRHRYPRVAVVILTGYAYEEYLTRALEAGAAGFLLKGSGVDEIGMAIRAVVSGHAYITPRMTNVLLSERLDENPIAHVRLRLTPRQRETLQLIADGKTNKEIAAFMNVTVKTVEKHRSELMQRLGVRNCARLVRYALDNGLI